MNKQTESTRGNNRMVCSIAKLLSSITLAALTMQALSPAFAGSWQDTDNDGIVDTFLPDLGETDSDADGIPDAVEALYGMDANDPSDAGYDIDSDGFSNLKAYNRDWELDAAWHGTDDDEDGINDVAEAHWVEIHSYLQVPGSSAPDLDAFGDPDMDGVLTGEELTIDYSLNPVLGQTTAGTDDWDAFSSLYEYYFGTLPKGGGAVGDVDSDGILDSWEYGWGLNFRDSADSLQDFDSDTLDNETEFLHGTNPYAADSDSDGEDDAQEVTQGTNPNDPMSSAWGILDPDGDGLTNAQEQLLGTNPNLADSDGDGVNDSVEIASGTNPQSPDSDADGVSDGTESTIGTDPNSADTDRDGLDDGQEQSGGTDPLDPDTDADNFSDGNEVSQGSDPVNSQSTPALGLPTGPFVQVETQSIEGASWKSAVSGIDDRWFYRTNGPGWYSWGALDWGHESSCVVTKKQVKTYDLVMPVVGYSALDQDITASMPFSGVGPSDHGSAIFSQSTIATSWEACWKKYRFTPKNYQPGTTPPHRRMFAVAFTGYPSTIVDTAIVNVTFADHQADGVASVTASGPQAYLADALVADTTGLRVEPKPVSGEERIVSVFQPEIAPAGGVVGVLGDVFPSALSDSDCLHFVTPKKSTALNQDYVEFETSGIDASQFSQFFEWEGGEPGSGENANKCKVKRDAVGMTEIKIKQKQGTVVFSRMKVWVVWCDASTPSNLRNYPSQAGTSTTPGAPQAGQRWVVPAYTLIYFTFTIKPESIITDQDIPAIKDQAKDTDPPGGAALKNGAELKWDVSRRIRFKHENTSPATVLRNEVWPPDNQKAKFDAVSGNYPAASINVIDYPANEVEGNDDTNVGDEDNKPYSDAETIVGGLTPEAKGKLASVDRVSGPFLMEAAGTQGEITTFKVHFGEFVRLEIGKGSSAIWYRVSDFVDWKAEQKFLRNASGNVDNGSGVTHDNSNY